MGARDTRIRLGLSTAPCDSSSAAGSRTPSLSVLYVLCMFVSSIYPPSNTERVRTQDRKIYFYSSSKIANSFTEGEVVAHSPRAPAPARASGLHLLPQPLLTLALLHECRRGASRLGKLILERGVRPDYPCRRTIHGLFWQRLVPPGAPDGMHAIERLASRRGPSFATRSNLGPCAVHPAQVVVDRKVGVTSPSGPRIRHVLADVGKAAAEGVPAAAARALQAIRTRVARPRPRWSV